MVDTLTLFTDAAHNRMDQELTDIADSLRLDGCPAGLITLISGSPRETNMVDQFQAVRDLLAEAFTLPEICHATHLSQASLAHLLQMVKLPQNLFDGVKDGKIKRGVAKALVKLTSAELEKASEICAENEGTLTGEDVEHLKDVRRENAAQALPASLFEHQEIPGWNAPPLDLEKTLEQLLSYYDPDAMFQTLRTLVDHMNVLESERAEEHVEAA